MPTEITNIDKLQKKLNGFDKKSETVIDWESRKVWWTGQIETLYSNIENWCKDIQTIIIEKFETTIEEKFMGVYTTHKLVLSISGQKFIFSPVGKNIIGGRGRVDVWYDKTKIMLILFEKDELTNKYDDKKIARNPEPEETEWFFVDSSRRPSIKLDQESFLKFLVSSVGA